MSTWVLFILTVSNTTPPYLQMLEGIKSEQECLKVLHTLEQTLPPNLKPRCIEVIKKEHR